MGRLGNSVAAILIAAGAGSGLAAAQTAIPDFRQVSWGASQAQVMASEPAKPTSISKNRGEVLLQYDSVPVSGLNNEVVYLFAKDQLVRAKLLFSADHDELNDFIRDYKTVEPWLTEHYGKPKREQALWQDDSTQLEPKSYLDQDRATPSSILPSDPLVGLAVALGQLRLYTRWETARSEIVHALTGQDHQVTHQIEYRSLTLQALEDQVRKQSIAPAP